MYILSSSSKADPTFDATMVRTAAGFLARYVAGFLVTTSAQSSLTSDLSAP